MSKKSSNRGEGMPPTEYARVATDMTPSDWFQANYGQQPAPEQAQQTAPQAYPDQTFAQPGYGFPVQPQGFGYPVQANMQPAFGYPGQPNMQPVYAYPGQQQAHQAFQNAQFQGQFMGQPSTETSMVPTNNTPASTAPENKNRLRVPRAPRHLGKRAIKVVGWVAGGVLVAGLGTGATVSIANGSAAAWLDSFNSEDSAPAEASGKDVDTVVADIEAGRESFKGGLCEKPEYGLMTATIDARLPLAPILTETDLATTTQTTGVVKPFLTEKKALAGDIPQDQVTESDKSEGYPLAVFEDLKLGISACATDPINSIIENSDGTTTVNMALFNIKFIDPNTLFNVPFITSIYTKDPTDTVTLEPNNGEYFYYSNPGYYIEKIEGDEAQNKSLADLSAAMETETQMKFILAMGETGAVNAMTSSQENISYPDGADDFREALKRSIAERLGLDYDKVFFDGVDFNWVPVVPRNSATKLPITDVDPTTGKSLLIGLDPTQHEETIIDSIEIEKGTLSEPVIPKREPSPTPTPTAEPVTGP